MINEAPDDQMDLFNWVQAASPQSHVEQFVDLLLMPGARNSARPNGSLKFDVWFGEARLITNHRVPIYAACRALVELGIFGTARVFRSDGVLAMTVSIAKGAKLTVSETNGAPRVVKYVPFEKGSVAKR
ncbi:MAG: hypothetical protein P0Y65_00335 [Candidatus Devosia phytovorans]|uniref:Uncharacterized protein n=1 Tax=Candidatus Devosia phytovorans TaxID=3121372 RepID=A0AAJ5VWF6_9HYPH|nr:hypothetical protein [Devosia sp.]WEK04742.1 MAG: hypothetical protein P0Y65_00335 [Devosia sp.]